ncbi:putative ribonuclease H-like domain-containing protein [Tanacetum coccineum]
MDVKSAFLYGKIEEEVYVCQPPEFEDPDFPDRVYKVEKALYRLHQALRAWYETLSTYLLDNRFQRGKIDKNLFIIRDKGDILLVQAYVDDIIFGSTKNLLCTEFEKMMHKKFQTSSMGELTFFLGLQVKEKEDGIFISQDKYVTEILKKFGFSDVKTASIPITPCILDTIMSDSEHSTVTYTSVPEDDSDIGSPGVEGPIFQDPPSPDYVPGPEGPPSPDYVPGPEEPEQAPPSPIYIPFVPEPVYPEFLPVDDEVFPAEEQPMPAADSPTHQSPGYIPESDPEEDDEEDPEEDPADYPADRGDDDDERYRVRMKKKAPNLAPADPTAVAYSADQDPYLAYRVTARMSIRHQAPAPFLSEEVAERLLALPTPPPSPLSPYSSPLPQIPSPPLPISSPPPISPIYVEGSMGSRAAGIRQRDALPVHETEMPEMCLPLRKRPRRTTPGPGYEVGESSAAGAARQFGPTTAEADLYGFTDMLEAAPGRQMSRELGYGIRDTWDDLVGAIQEIAPTTLEGVNQRVIELSTTVDQEDEIIYSQLDDARYDRALLRARVNRLDSDRPFHRRTALLIEEEARLSRAAWARSMDACDQEAGGDYRSAESRLSGQRQLVETLKIVKSLKAQMIELQRQQGPAKDPAEPELPEEAGSST